jgi:hypothetical protein
MVMNSAERETMGLCIALEAVNDIANRALLEVRPISSLPGEAEVYFITRVHQELFLARLLDFSKEPGTKSITGVAGSCLDVLQAACETRSFDVDGCVTALADSVTAFRDWLDKPTKLKMWIATLGVEAEVELPRSQLVFIMGNHVKHNLARLSGVSSSVGKLLRGHGYAVEDQQVPLALDDIREHLQENYFVYYGSWLAELINNLRWGIQEYLLPVFQQSYARVPGHDYKYEYRYPSSIADKIAREWFWRLMNHVRVRPYIDKFAGAHYLKKAASIEKP